MPKFITRIVALLLVGSLLVDPVVASALIVTGVHGAQTDSAPWESENHFFAAQAIIPELCTGIQTVLKWPRAKKQFIHQAEQQLPQLTEQAPSQTPFTRALWLRLTAVKPFRNYRADARAESRFTGLIEMVLWLGPMALFLTRVSAPGYGWRLTAASMIAHSLFVYSSLYAEVHRWLPGFAKSLGIQPVDGTKRSKHLRAQLSVAYLTAGLGGLLLQSCVSPLAGWSAMATMGLVAALGLHARHDLPLLRARSPEIAPAQEPAKELDFLRKWGVWMGLAFYACGIITYGVWGTGTWIQWCAFTVPIGVGASLIGMAKSDTKVNLSRWVVAATLGSHIIFSVFQAKVLPPIVGGLQHKFNPVTERQTRTFLSFLFGMFTSGNFDVFLPIIQKYANVLYLFRRGKDEEARERKSEIRWGAQIWRMIDSTASRIAFAYVLYDLSLNAVPPEYSIFVMFTLGFALTIYRSFASHKQKGGFSRRSVFYNGLLVVYASYVLSPATAIAVLCLVAVSTFYFYRDRLKLRYLFGHRPSASSYAGQERDLGIAEGGQLTADLEKSNLERTGANEGHRWSASSVAGRGVALLCMLITLPVFLILVPLAGVHSKDSLFVSQERVGFQGNLIQIHKLRTKIFDPLESSTETHAEFTWFGRWADRTRLNEWPQLWAIVKGDIAWFGPRATLPGGLHPDYSQTVLSLTEPGLISLNNVRHILCLAMGGPEQDPAERLRLDLQDVREASIGRNFQALLWTIAAGAAVFWQTISPVRPQLFIEILLGHLQVKTLAAQDPLDHSIGSDHSTGFTRAEHETYHEEARIAWVLGLLVEELRAKGIPVGRHYEGLWKLRNRAETLFGARFTVALINGIGTLLGRGKNRIGWFKIRKAVEQQGDVIPTDHGRLKIDNKGPYKRLVIIDDRFQKAHAGRDEYAVYAPNEIKAAHEGAELDDLAQKVVENPRIPITVKDIQNGFFGTKLRRRTSGPWWSPSRREKRRQEVIDLAEASHAVGLEAEKLAAVREAESWVSLVMNQHLRVLFMTTLTQTRNTLGDLFTAYDSKLGVFSIPDHLAFLLAANFGRSNDREGVFHLGDALFAPESVLKEARRGQADALRNLEVERRRFVSSKLPAYWKGSSAESEILSELYAHFAAFISVESPETLSRRQEYVPGYSSTFAQFIAERLSEDLQLMSGTSLPENLKDAIQTACFVLEKELNSERAEMNLAYLREVKSLDALWELDAASALEPSREGRVIEADRLRFWPRRVTLRSDGLQWEIPTSGSPLLTMKSDQREAYKEFCLRYREPPAARPADQPDLSFDFVIASRGGKSTPRDRGISNSLPGDIASQKLATPTQWKTLIVALKPVIARWGIPTIAKKAGIFESIFRDVFNGKRSLTLEERRKLTDTVYDLNSRSSPQEVEQEASENLRQRLRNLFESDPRARKLFDITFGVKQMTAMLKAYRTVIKDRKPLENLLSEIESLKPGELETKIRAQSPQQLRQKISPKRGATLTGLILVLLTMRHTWAELSPLLAGTLQGRTVGVPRVHAVSRSLLGSS